MAGLFLSFGALRSDTRVKGRVLDVVLSDLSVGNAKGDVTTPDGTQNPRPPSGSTAVDRYPLANRNRATRARKSTTRSQGADARFALGRWICGRLKTDLQFVSAVSLIYNL